MQRRRENIINLRAPRIPANVTMARQTQHPSARAPVRENRQLQRYEGQELLSEDDVLRINALFEEEDTGKFAIL